METALGEDGGRNWLFGEKGRAITPQGVFGFKACCLAKSLLLPYTPLRGWDVECLPQRSLSVPQLDTEPVERASDRCRGPSAGLRAQINHNK